MTLIEPSTTGTTQDAPVYSSAQSTYTPYEFTAPDLKFVVPAHAPASDFADVLARLKRLAQATNANEEIHAGYKQLADDEEYLSVRRETRTGGAARASRNAQD